MAQELTKNLQRAGWDKELLNLYEKGDYRKLAISLVKKSFDKGENPDTRADGMFGPFAMDSARGKNQVKAAIRNLRDEARKDNKTLSGYVKNLKEESLNEDFESFDTEEDEDFENVDEAVLSPAQRMKKRAQFRKHRGKVKRGQERAKRRRPDAERVEKRAKRQARTQVKKAFTQGKNPSDLSPTQKASVERRVQGRSKQIDRLTRRLKPKVRQKARESLEYKASTSPYDFATIAEVFIRGFDDYPLSENTSHLTPEQYAFARVNSFLTGGYAAKLDEDLLHEKSDGGPPDEGTKAAAEYAKKKIPGQNVKTTTKGDSKLDVRFEDFNAVSAFKQNKGKQFDLWKTVRDTVRKTTMSDEFKKTLALYTNKIKKQPNKDRMQLAVKAANEIGMITPREFTTFLKQQIKKGRLPQELSV